jgi:hypothetical protein
MTNQNQAEFEKWEATVPEIVRKTSKNQLVWKWAWDAAFHSRDAEIDRLKAALRFYADEKNWNWMNRNSVFKDQGTIARDVLGGKSGSKIEEGGV